MTGHGEIVAETLREPYEYTVYKCMRCGRIATAERRLAEVACEQLEEAAP